MSPMDLRREFVHEALGKRYSMTELCATYAISRKTGYKWLARFEQGGRAALHDQSRRPHHSPEAISDVIAEALVAARQRKPYWGARKLRKWLMKTQPRTVWPGRSTIHHVLKQRGLTRTPRRCAGRPPLLTTQPLTAATHPNDVWTVDFKGHFRLRSGPRCYPLTLRDLASRYTLRCDALPGEQTVATQDRLRRAFTTYGLPRCIRSDNGKPFASHGFAGLSRLAVWWLRLGIQVERIAPGRPDQNGSHERFHRDLKAQTARPPARHLRAQQGRFDRFVVEYNEERPHEALADTVPAEHYRVSPRRLPTRLPALDYPKHWEPRLVSANGMIGWRNRPAFLSAALAGETVAFDEVDDGVWTVHFATMPIARWLERERRFRALRAD
jgi:putative transposase